MKFTLSWLKDHIDTKESLADLIHHLTMLGIEVESFDDPTPRLAPFLIAQIKRIEKHPDADRLNICYVEISPNPHDPLVQVVCGAPNVYEGMKTVFAHIGTYIPGLDITLKQGNIRGVSSNGMLCSLNELGLGKDQEGIVNLPASAETGYPFAKAFGHDDPVIEVNVTPNRSDCFGVVGIARDLAAAGFGKYIHKKTPVIKGTSACSKTINIESFDDCPVYMGRMIHNVTNTESPQWLQQRLKKIGIDPISAIVDITNYINYDLCRPLHAFDANKLQGNITVRRAKNTETMVGLNEKSYSLSSDHLVVADESGPIAIAGVLGGQASGTTMDTTTVFLESALFHPHTVATSGRDLNIHTDSRMRFERGVDPESVRFGLDSATRMILDICGGDATDITVAGVVPVNLKEVQLSLDKVKLLTGISIPTKTIDKYLTGLGFTNIHSVPGGLLKMTTPSWRFDITNEHDIIEEIIRVHGYDRLPTTTLTISPGFKALSFKQSIPLVTKKALVAQGFHECIHYAFTSESAAQHFKLDNDLIAITNPISQQLSHMRPAVLPSLLDSVQRNIAYRHTNLSLFELGSVYGLNQGTPYQETLVTALLTGCQPQDWRTAQQTYDVFNIKADLWTLLDTLGINTNTLQLDNKGAPSWYHPGQSATVQLGPKRCLGYFGRLHPKTEQAFDIHQPVYAFEIFLDRLPVKPPKHKAYRPNLLQPVDRDFAFIVDSSVPAAKVLKAVESADKDIIQDIRLFDVYTGKGVPEGKQSLALTVKFVPKDTTFTDDQIQRLSQTIVDCVKKNTGGELRSASL